MNDAVNQRRVLRMPEVCRVTGLGKSTIYQKLTEGSFPSPIRLGPRAVGWRAVDILDWLEDPGRAWNPSEGK